jgi:DNA-binding PadR family transcriptional regulator
LERGLFFVKEQNGILVLSAQEEDILTVLLGKELYGLQIIQAVNVASQCKRDIGFGSLYPALNRLSKNGLLKSRWGDEIDEESGGARRKYYKVTGLGERVLHETQNYRAALSVWQPGLA